jgi:16S rRNA (adenine1518-N6/adenine1519-N6)-dimethyltransferase
VFWPRPKVNSAIVSLWRHDGRGGRILDRPFFLDFIRRLFHHRRKLMRSVLCGMYRKEISKSEVDAILTELEFGPEPRAEQLDVPSLLRLANRFYQVKTGESEPESPRDSP